MSDMTVYERERQARIAANQARLKVGLAPGSAR